MIRKLILVWWIFFFFKGVFWGCIYEILVIFFIIFQRKSLEQSIIFFQSVSLELQDFLSVKNTWITWISSFSGTIHSFLTTKKSLSKPKCTLPTPLQHSSSSSSGSQPARRRALWPTADLNYCNQWMKSNQQPCMSCWQNAWPPVLSPPIRPLRPIHN